MASLIRDKWKNKQGTTMLMALLYTLVCITVGVIVLSAAYANASRSHRNRTEQQNYQAVASAVRLVRDRLTGQTYEDSWIQTTVEIQEENEEGELITRTEVSYSAGRSVYPTDGLLPHDVLHSVYLTYYVPSAWWEGTIITTPAARTDLDLSLKGGAVGETKVPDVLGSMSVITSRPATSPAAFDLKLSFWVPGETEGEKSFLTTLLLTAQVEHVPDETVVSGDTTAVTNRLKVTWGEPRVVKGVPKQWR